jgi:hypothetical protein
MGADVRDRDVQFRRRIYDGEDRQVQSAGRG